jgi:hypothetical protein
LEREKKKKKRVRLSPFLDTCEAKKRPEEEEDVEKNE